jgi:cell division protein FtsI (penicillin-binding protein 3)
MEADTGAILAMASLPSYDPNHFRGVEASHFRHRALGEVFEPGSTMKPFVVAEVLELGLATSDETLFCENGVYHLGRNAVHDHDPYGYLTVEEVLVVSSNIGLTKLGERLGPAKLEAMYRRYGFGSRTDIELRDEIGILRPSSAWSRIGFATHTFGQGMAVTAIQEVTAFAALVNGGMQVRPHLVREIRDLDGETVPLARDGEELKRLLSESTSAEIRRIMGGVLEKGGTAPIARLAEYSAGGKTGTAQKVKDGRYAKGLYVSSFIGFAPRDDPKVVTLVVLDEPTRKWYGGTVAGPVFREVTTHALRELGIAPDLKTKQGLVKSKPRESAQRFSYDESPLPILTAADQGWTMPDLGGRPLRDVMKIFGPSGVGLEMEGFGLVIKQEPRPGRLLMPQDTVRIALSTRGGSGSTQ